MDLIAQALAKREKLKAELDRVDTFLGMAYELQGDDGTKNADKANAENAPAPVKRAAISRGSSGVGAETARIAQSIVREIGRPMPTRELVPLIEAHNIEIGGKDKVATLSARLGNDAKRQDGRLRLKAGKWHLLEWLDSTDNEETADSPNKDASAASFFSNQEGGDHMPPP